MRRYIGLFIVLGILATIFGGFLLSGLIRDSDNYARITAIDFKAIVLDEE